MENIEESNNDSDLYLNDVKVTSKDIEELTKDPSVRLYEEKPKHYRKLIRMTD
jgi:hypothetical protein